MTLILNGLCVRHQYSGESIHYSESSVSSVNLGTDHVDHMIRTSKGLG